MNKKIIKTVVLSVVMLFLTILPLSVSIYAGSDLPIDEDEFHQVEGMGTRAVTVSKGVELFTERSREITQAMVTQHEARREEAFGGLFDPAFQLDELTGRERLLDQAVTSGLFGEGVSFRESSPAEVVEEEPILLIVILLIMCGVAGFIIAMLSLQRKEKKENVH